MFSIVRKPFTEEYGEIAKDQYTSPKINKRLVGTGFDSKNIVLGLPVKN
jgi:hypothetical protein